MLSKELFSSVIENTPLVSIDLVIKNTKGQVLLGKRLNRPAKHFWFVPGGRILKDESLAKAFERLTADELGQAFKLHQASLLGPYDHFYSDNVFGDQFSTHYVAIAYILNLDTELTELPINIQHGGYEWFDIEDLLVDETVHKHTKNYFRSITT